MADVTIPAGHGDAATFYDTVGGEETFRRLVHRFYEGVRDDPVLRPLYPEPDLSGAEERLRMFLVQYWGGPRTYSDQRGHPRLRMRHAPFRRTRLHSGQRSEYHGRWAAITPPPYPRNARSGAARPRSRCRSRRFGAWPE